ncbi:hypothetical protein BURPS305_2114 [Burkholderia pseudomallei 305]|nr:hypothetical protein BURPS305_2114 [Burkholderia pseudomallei 305]
MFRTEGIYCGSAAIFTDAIKKAIGILRHQPESFHQLRKAALVNRNIDPALPIFVITQCNVRLHGLRCRLIFL